MLILATSLLWQPAEAIVQLQSLLRSVPQNEEALLALANYSAELGQRENALSYARALIKIAPGNRSYQQMYKSLAEGNP